MSYLQSLHKSDRQPALEPDTGNLVELFHPQQQLWLDHFSWSEDATQIIGITPTGRATIAPLRMNRLQLIRVRRMWVAMEEHPPEIDLVELWANGTAVSRSDRTVRLEFP